MLSKILLQINGLRRKMRLLRLILQFAGFLLKTIRPRMNIGIRPKKRILRRNAGFLGCLFMNKYHINYHAYSNASYN